jgi:hypothetical protein
MNLVCLIMIIIMTDDCGGGITFVNNGSKPRHIDIYIQSLKCTTGILEENTKYFSYVLSSNNSIQLERVDISIKLHLRFMRCGLLNRPLTGIYFYHLDYIYITVVTLSHIIADRPRSVLEQGSAQDCWSTSIFK